MVRKNGLDANTPRALAAKSIHAQVLARVNRKLHAFPAHAQIRTVALLRDEWTITNGALTPTLKLKRPVIEQRYGEVIEALYAGHDIPK